MLSFLLLQRRAHDSNRFFLHTAWAFSSVTEEWKDIVDCSNYQVSNLGNVRNKKLNRMFQLNIGRCKRANQSMQILVKDNQNKRRRFLLNRAVLMHFRPRNGMENLYALHLDGDKYNNELSNLEWSEVKKRYGYPSVKRYGSKEVIAHHDEFGDYHFTSIKECQQYLVSLDIGVTLRVLTGHIYQKLRLARFTFRFADERLYDKSVPCLEEEEWRPFHVSVRMKTYYVSNLVRIKTVNQKGIERLIQPSEQGGYAHVLIYHQSIGRCKLVHRLVAEQFVPNPRQFAMLDHIDTNRRNNKATNLRWVKDAAANASNERTRLNLSESQQIKRRVLQIDRHGNLVRIWQRPHQITRETGYDQSSLSKVLNNKRGRKTAYGFCWRYFDENSS